MPTISRNPDTPSSNILMFCPDLWGECQKFAKFHQSTYSFGPQTTKRLSGVGNHFKKAGDLVAVAKQLVPALEQDNAELRQSGFTPAKRHSEIAAVIETAFVELYSSLDCTRYVVADIYWDAPGFSKKKGRESTRGLFQAAADGLLDSVLPAALILPFRNASWFSELRGIRDELTHADVGMCVLRDDGVTLSYMHTGMGSPQQALVIEDIFEKISMFSTAVNSLLGEVFRFLNSTLNSNVTDQICGMFSGKLFQRVVSFSEAIDRHAGICKSFEWFDKDGNARCPLADECGAYARRPGVHKS